MVNKLDLGQAWNQAVALLTTNVQVVMVVAAVFFFLPNAISSLAMPQPTELEAMMGGATDPETILAAMVEFYGQIWWIFVLLALFQAVGALCLLMLLTDRSRPTVGEALMFGLKALVPYILVQLLANFIILSALVLPIALGMAIDPAAGVLLLPVGIGLAVYLWVRLSLAGPAMAIEKQLNPIVALQRSWQLTGGNVLLLFAFYMLLIVALGVLGLVATMAFAIFSVFGDDIGLFASAIGGSLFTMIALAVMLAVSAAVYRQLSGDVAVKETFD